jgi:hypothetical protein
VEAPATYLPRRHQVPRRKAWESALAGAALDSRNPGSSPAVPAVENVVEVEAASHTAANIVVVVRSGIDLAAPQAPHDTAECVGLEDRMFARAVVAQANNGLEML